MRIRITRPWQIRDCPFSTLVVGKVFDVATSIAMYLMAMHCAEPVRRQVPLREKQRGHHLVSKTPISRFVRNGSIAEARLRLAGRWHRLRVELDEALMAQCSFYLKRGV